VAELNKTQLVERIGKHLGKLKREELVSLAERVESKTLDLSALTLSGDGGFGFQEEARESSGAGGESGSADDSGHGEGLLERGADQGRSLLDKAKSAVTGDKG
jgi:hypothetical protein